jgi:hypothetical protein
MKIVAALLAVCSLPHLAAADTIAVDVNVDVRVDVARPEVIVAEPELPVSAPPVVRPALLDGSRWEAGVVATGGSFALGDLGGGQAGVRAFAGRQLGILRVAVEYGVAKFWASRDVYDAAGWWTGWEDEAGELRRLGATARLRGVFDDPMYPNLGLAFYLEAGAGKQWLIRAGQRESQREIERRDYVLGVGLEVVGGDHRMGGMDLGVRLVAAPALDPMDPTHDLAVIGHLGGTFGW